MRPHTRWVAVVSGWGVLLFAAGVTRARAQESHIGSLTGHAAAGPANNVAMKLAVVIGTLAALAAAQETATVEGVVVNKVTGAGIGGATVRLVASRTNRYEITTDDTGAFEKVTAVEIGHGVSSETAGRALFFQD